MDVADCVFTLAVEIAVDVSQAIMESKLRDLRQQLTEAEGAIKREQGRIAWIGPKVELLEELLAEARNGQPTEAVVPDEDDAGQEAPGGADRLRPSEAVVRLLKDNQGLQIGTIIDSLEHEVESNAKNVRHNIRTTVFNLVKKGIVIRTEDDKYYLANQ